MTTPTRPPRSTDAFLQYMRFGRGRTESTSRKYAEAVALYFSYCRTRQAPAWTDPNMTAFQMWLRVAQSPRRSAPVRQSGSDTARPVRSDNHINLISYVVTEMFKFAGAEGYWPPTSWECYSRSPGAASRRRPSRNHDLQGGPSAAHRLRTRPVPRRDAPVDVVKALFGACGNNRDVLLVALLATTGMRGGEALGVRLSDLHFLPRRRCWAVRWKGRTCTSLLGTTATAPS